jgi:hypothetical protein
MHGAPSDGVGLGTAAGASKTALGPGIRIPPSGFPHHHHFDQRNRFGYWGPVYYGGYIPFDYDYDYYSDYPGYTGYAPGTFQSVPYPYPDGGYPYPPAYAPPPNYRPPAPYPAMSYTPPEQSAPVAQAARQPQPSTTARGVTTANGPEKVSEPTVLVFRDGHKQEVENYAIMGPTLFVLSGRHARIPIAELNVPETIRQNESRGLEFHIPGRGQ